MSAICSNPNCPHCSSLDLGFELVFAEEAAALSAMLAGATASEVAMRAVLAWARKVESIENGLRARGLDPAEVRRAALDKRGPA